MCLRIMCGPHVADKAMTVWKVIKFTNLSMWQSFVYEPNHRYETVELTVINKSNYVRSAYLIINEGYHAFTNLRAAHDEIVTFGSGYKVVKFTIPKGATYFIGDDDDIVSNRIISGDLKSQYQNP